MDRNETADPLDRNDRALMATIATPLRIGPADHGRTMTLEEFMEADVEEGYRYELARGVLDYETKREEYLAYGLLEYWIVDPMERRVTVLTRRGDVWHEAVFRDEQTIISRVLPGFATTVAELWIDVEEDDETDDLSGNGS
jgi:hypothetical protein